jgi:thiamine phosphate synthase YjbQ (UPF0047 family)
VPPLELTLELRPQARLDVINVRARAREVHGTQLDQYSRCFYASRHTTAGYLPQSLASRLTARPGVISAYLELIRTLFPEGAGYQHDQLDLRHELAPEQRSEEPANADSHLAFMGGGLHACVSYNARRPGPVYFVDLDGTHKGVSRTRSTTMVGYDREVEVARMTVDVPVSSHPIQAVSLKDTKLGFYEELSEFIGRCDVSRGRVRLELDAAEPHASLTINEYETLLMQHDLAEVLRNPLKFAAEKARHAWNDPFAVPAKAIGYAKYDLVCALNRVVDRLGLGSSRLEGLMARTLAVPASRFLRMRRSVDLFVSDAAQPGRPAMVEGIYQTPILVQWRPACRASRKINVSLTQFL